ncbi:alpha/beta fold hydrolase [Candidatus Woesebacteria bacterium]|nr:MAG: alpha/beta fold hydrolase [Candidatus Woesebacteria bacterium]
MPKNRFTLLLVIFCCLTAFTGFSFTYIVLNNYVEKSPTAVSDNFNQQQSSNQQPLHTIAIQSLRERVYESDLSELEKISHETDTISYLTSYVSDGLKIHGLLVVPTQDMPTEGWPAIVFVHGYIPPDDYKTETNYTSYVKYLAGKGCVVFKIDLRGHGESEGSPSGAYYSEGYVVDTLNAYSALSKSRLVDKTRVGLWGHSMAGNIVFRSFVVNNDIPKIVIWAGAVYTYQDFVDYGISDNSYRPPTDNKRALERKKLFDTYGEFNKDSEFWKSIVPTNYLSGVRGRVQLHHAVNDNVVSINYTRNLVKILDANNIKYEIYEYPFGGHNLEGSVFNQAMDRTAEFLTSD